MRMSRWTPDIVRFMRDADRVSPYFRELAGVVATQLPRGGRMLDAGCGMGQLSLALAGHAGAVDAVDRNEQAVAGLAKTVRRLGLSNVRPVCADMFDWCRQAGARARGAGLNRRATTLRSPYDLAVFCLSASFEDAYAAACRMGAGRVLVINKIHARQARDTRPTVDDLDAALARNRRIDGRCQGTRLRLDYGQPLRSLEDAVLYFSLFRTRTYPHGVTAEQVEGLLERRDDATFPYYLPVWRDLALFCCPTDREAAPGVGQDGRWDAVCGSYSSPCSRNRATACIFE